MRLRFGNFLQLSMLLLDLFTLNLILMVTSFLVFTGIDDFLQEKEVQFILTINLLWIILAMGLRTYSGKYIYHFESFSKRSLFTYFVYLGTISMVFMLAGKMARYHLSLSLLAFGFMLFVNRFIYLVIYDVFKSKHILEKRIVIIGYNELAKKLVSHLESESANNQIVGFCENDKVINELTGYPIISTVDEAVNVSRDFNVNEIFSTISPEQDRSIYSLMQQADQECIRFKLVPDLSHFINRPYHLEFHKGIPIISLRNEPLDEVQNRVIKRGFDIVVSMLVSVFILSWLVPLMAILIKLDSKGPVFFVQERSGKDNKTFRCLKFRSMRMTKEADIRQATKDDDRFTRLGRFLRRSNLDEFPQFLNVLKGDMSVVGPRPHMLKHTQDYSRLINQYMIRQFLKPGITGWAQINGFRGETKTTYQMQQRVEHDIYYMENWSVWLDLKIMFLTVYNVFAGEENAF